MCAASHVEITCWTHFPSGLLQKLRHVPAAEAGCGGRDKCMEDTRVDLLRDLLSWAKDPDTEPVFWLNGMAGTGKTTIAETLALQLHNRKLLAASFFCSRASADRNDIKRIFPTIAYRLAYNITSFHSALLEAIKANENAAHRDLVDQFGTLIEGPLQQACEGASVAAPKIIIVDALDECVNPDATKLLLDIILKYAWSFSPVIKFFVTSRPEPRIRYAFESDKAGTHSVLRLHEIGDSVIEADIKLYMTKRLGAIIQLRSEYSDCWPPEEVDILAKRADKLFIYASTLCGFIEGVNPVGRFRDICAMAHKIRFHTIDEIYMFILESAFKGLQDYEIPTLQHLLAAIVFLRNPLCVRDIGSLLRMQSHIVRENLGALHSVLQVPPANDKGIVTFYHASFPDYLTDSKRSGGQPWAVDPSNTHSYLLERCLDKLLLELHFNVSQTRHSLLKPSERSTSIAVHLAYACQYWPEHLFALPDHLADLGRVELFIRKEVLHWLEALIVLDMMHIALVPLRKLANVCGVLVESVRLADRSCTDAACILLSLTDRR